jgi:hypothetical protein
VDIRTRPNFLNDAVRNRFFQFVYVCRKFC